MEAQFKYILLFVVCIYCDTSKALNLCIVRGENPPVVPVFTVIIIVDLL